MSASPPQPPDATLRQVWAGAEIALFTFLDELEATEDASTLTIRVTPREIESPQEFVDTISPRVSHDGTWSFVTTATSSGKRYGFAMPVARSQPKDVLALPFVEIHTLLVAWWLTTAWRVRQLARAGSTHADEGDDIAAAACARPLVETAAACWVDGGKLVAAWDDIKRAGTPLTDQDAMRRRSRMMDVLNEVIWGARFDERVPELNQLWGRFKRSNVLGQVEKLGKAAGGDLQADYQWLCNTVHPSIGNTFVFCAPPFVHDTGTHMIQWFAGRAIHVERGGVIHVERTVQIATARAAARALTVLRRVLDDALRAIDDVALTTGAPAITRETYWRNIIRPERNELCPCRSGRKAKRCPHEWGDAAPTFPSSFG
jgi:hypothetical protein